MFKMRSYNSFGFIVGLFCICLATWTAAQSTNIPAGFYAGRLEGIQAKINAGKVPEAITDYLGLLALPGTPKLNFYDQLLFDYGRVLLLNKQYDDAMRVFEQAVDAGFADVAQLTRNTTYDVLRTRPEFAAVVAKAKANLQNQRGLIVLELNNLQIEGDYTTMSFNGSDTPRVQDLRHRYQLNEIGTSA